jgi:hypothetical protein
MKKIYFLVPFLIFCIEKSTAQTQVFIQTGLNATNTIMQNIANDQYLVSKSEFVVTPNFGVDVHLPVYKKIRLNIAAQYSTKGLATFNDGGGCGNSPIFYGKTTYIDILPRLSLPIYKKVALLGGVNLGVKIKEKYLQSDEFIGGSAEKTPTSVVFNANNRYDFGGLIGFQVKFQRFNVQAHYNRSFYSVMSEEFVQQHFLFGEPKFQTYNQTFQIALSYYLEPLIP